MKFEETLKKKFDNTKSYNDYIFKKPTIEVDDYKFVFAISKGLDKLTLGYITMVVDTRDKAIVDSIKEYCLVNKISGATLINEKSLIDTIKKAQAFDIIKNKQVDVEFFMMAMKNKHYKLVDKAFVKLAQE